MNILATLSGVAQLSTSTMTMRNVQYFFLEKYDNGGIPRHESDELKLQIINDNFTRNEISDTIDSLKNNDILESTSCQQNSLKVARQSYSHW